MVPLDEMDAWVNAWFTQDGPFAHTEIIETITVPGNDYADEIAEIDATIREIDPDAPDYDDQHARLRAERSRLLSLPSEKATATEHPTGRTVGDVWASLDDAQRRRFLLATNTQVYCLSSKALRAESGPRRLGPMRVPPSPDTFELPLTDIPPNILEHMVQPVETGEILYILGNPWQIATALRNLTD